VGHLDGIHALAFSADGRVLASAGCDARARVWDPARGRRLTQVRGAEALRTVALTGDTLVLGCAPGELGLWRTTDGSLLASLGTQDNPKRQVMLARTLAAGQVLSVERADPRAPLMARLWDTRTGKEIRSVLIKVPPFHWRLLPGALDVSPDGQLLAVVDPELYTGTGVFLWDLSTGELVGKVEGHRGGVQAVAFGPSGKVLATGSNDCTVLLWSVARRDGR
jgi:WD40 repeat protein